MGRRLRSRVPVLTPLKRIKDCENLSLCGLIVRMEDDRIAELISSNGKVFKILVDNKYELIPITENFTERYKNWIIIN